MTEQGPAPSTGEAGFIAGLALQGIEAERRGEIVVYKLEAVCGAHCGKSVDTGVAAAELAGWPMAPPHWVHLPNNIRLDAPHPSDIAGWSRYSRPHPGRLDAAENPAVAWVAHVRELLSRAT